MDKKSPHPDTIFLQVSGESLGDWEGVTWAANQINDTDVEYVRKDSDEQVRLEKDAAFLSFLEAWGVDNWDEGYRLANVDFRKWKEENGYDS